MKSPQKTRGLTRELSANARKRDQLLDELRQGLPEDPQPVNTLRVIACRTPDQTIQKTALAGLALHASPEAVLAVAERLLDTWGMGAIGRAIRLSGKLWQHGGLVALSEEAKDGVHRTLTSIAYPPLREAL